MRPVAGRLLGLAVAIALVGVPRWSFAQLRTCIHVEAGAGPTVVETSGLARWVATELDRHPTHRAASADCQSHLTVEVVDLGTRGGKWLTGRINTQVPHREMIRPEGGVVAAVERLLTVILHNDPLVLRGPQSNGWFDRQGRALELRSRVHFGAEFYQLGSRLGSSLETLPGFAITMRREVSALFVGLRLSGALNPGNLPERLRLKAQFDAQIESAVYATPASSLSPFASAVVGLVHHRFEGPAPLDGPEATGIATSTGLSLGLRAGVEAMRTSDVHLVAFLQVTAPAFVSTDPDRGVVDQWVPTAALGVGVVF
jgi:hypothetical protein